MPKETRTNIWVVGADGSGKTTLITLFPIAALRVGWILVPDENSSRIIYGWQHDFFSNGKFPPKGIDQRADKFSFSNFNPPDWEISQLGSGRLRTQRSVSVVERSLSSGYTNEKFEEELEAQANFNEELGVIYCLDVNHPDESSIAHLQDIVNALRKSKRRKIRRLCIAFTKTDLLAQPRFLGENNLKIFDDEYLLGNGGSRRQKINILPNDVLEIVEQSLGFGATRDLREIVSAVASREKGTGRLETSFEVCTAVGVAKDQDDKYRPNVQELDVESDDVYERHQLWWSGIERVLMRALGTMPISM